MHVTYTSHDVQSILALYPQKGRRRLSDENHIENLIYTGVVEVDGGIIFESPSAKDARERADG